MSKIGYGYGSEWHLLRFLGYHRDYLNNHIKSNATGFAKSEIDWFDHHFSKLSKKLHFDAERKTIDVFNSISLNKKWLSFWPSLDRAQNWDAVAMAKIQHKPEYIFVEAKAHIGELKSTCGAKSIKSCNTIEKALESTRNYFDIKATKNCEDNWLNKYYQYANRLAFLSFLLENNIKAHLLFIYFTGDSFPASKGKAPKRNQIICPKSKAEWEAGWKNNPGLNQMYKDLCIDYKKLKRKSGNRIHSIFLPVHP